MVKKHTRTEFALSYGKLSLNRLPVPRNFELRAVSSDGDHHHIKTEIVAVARQSKSPPVARFQEIVSSLPHVAFVVIFLVGFCLVFL